MSYVAEIYYMSEGKIVVEERQPLEAANLEDAQQEAAEWVAALGAVLYRATYVRIVDGEEIVKSRPLGVEPWEG